jgi:hypothetical protein
MLSQYEVASGTLACGARVQQTLMFTPPLLTPPRGRRLVGYVASKATHLCGTRGKVHVSYRAR